MHFEVPDSNVTFEIPDEWWRFADMDTFTVRAGSTAYRSLVGAMMRSQSPMLNRR